MTRGLRHGNWLGFLPLINSVTNINHMIMTDEDLESERRYRMEERLGIVCGADVPTDDQLALAIAGADEWVEVYRLLSTPICNPTSQAPVVPVTASVP